MIERLVFNVVRALFLISLVTPPFPPPEATATPPLFLEEKFVNLDRWTPLSFPDIERQSTYRTGHCNGKSCLMMASDNSASGLLLKKSFNVYTYPNISWRWKVSNVYQKGDSSKKSGDDYPARLYILFAYDKSSASFGKQLKYNMAKLIYGQYPPDSSISYIWANKVTTKPYVINAYTDEARMIAVSSGKENVQSWQQYSRNIVEDYIMAFGKKPPATASLAVMCDADNTHEAARAQIASIRIEANE